ncbi:MAG: ABC transporter permease [Spirochaetaceae bacterium]|nr:ABC transporter permease [Spirochaetaceae bacterium]
MKIKAFVQNNTIFLLLVLAFLASAAFVPHFISSYNMKNFLLQSTDLLLIASGLTFIVLNGGIDFSVTSVLALGSVVGAYIMAISPLSATPAIAIPVAVIAMISIGAAVGAINGVAVTILKMPSFIATLSTQLIFSGLAVLFTSIVASRTSIFGLPEAFFVLGGDGKAFIVPIIIALFFVALAYWILEYTRFGRHILSVGTNPKASYISGVPVKKVIFTICLLSGLYAGIASVILTARNQAGISSMGDTMFISIIASIVIGGTSILGGSGGFKQTLVGVLFITLINNVMNLMGIPWFITMIVQGLMILFAALSDFIVKSRKSLFQAAA